MSSNPFKHIPKVDRILKWAEIARLLDRHPKPEVLLVIRQTLDNFRKQLAHDSTATPDRTAISEAVLAGLARRTAASLRKVINGSGVVVHTNLGRSPLAEAAVKAMTDIAGCYANLEYDLQSGQRGRRIVHVEHLICELTGAESALVVNNNAAAVMLALSTLAAGREVVVSRGELVEIGGSFRIPDVMRQSGALLVEVGTTNRTHPGDYLSAVNEATAMFLKVHTSNFAVVGFTAETTVAELAALGRDRGIPVMLDAGSGCLVDLSPYGITGEATIRQHLADGADVVTFSGDKLLGGPQAGIIAGKRAFIEPMKSHPLLRAMRMDKISLAALEATLRLYRDERKALTEIPTLRMLTWQPAELSARADKIVRRLRRALPANVHLSKHRGESSAGGGSFPLLQLPTTLIEASVNGATPQQLEAALRSTATAVVGRIHRDRYLLDVRTLLDQDLPQLAEALTEAAAILNRSLS